MKVKYKIKNLTKEASKKKSLSEEETLNDLLTVLPTLKKHKMSEAIESKVKTLRSGRKTKAFNLELSREFFYTDTAPDTTDAEGNYVSGIVTKHKSISVSAPVEKASDKFAVVRALKEQIIAKVKEKRKAMRPMKEEYSFNYGLTVPKMDGVFLEKDSVLKAMFKKVRMEMKNNKTPTDSKTRYVGVEIELAAVENREVLCDAIFAAGIAKHICVKDDGSIGYGARDGMDSKLREKFPNTHEVCVLAKESEIEDVITKLCNVLNKVLHTAIDKTCGLHVHFDMRNRDHKISFNNLVLSQQFLYAMLPAQRRNSGYSFPIKGSDYRDVESRYHGVNATAYKKYKTLELRMHSGTTSDNKINNWIRLGIAICDAPKFTAAPTTVAAFKAAANLSAEVTEYVVSRVTKFASQHEKLVPDKEEPGTMPNLDKSVYSAPADMLALEDSEVA